MELDRNLWYLIVFFRFIITSLALVLLCFFLCNILLILMPIYPLPEWNLIQTRVALASVVNLAPLCMGGRAPIVDALNISRQSYYLAHAWIGAIATIEALMHSGISLLQKQDKQKPPKHNVLTSGWIGMGLLLGAFCMPIPVIKRLFGRWFLWVHRVLAIGAVAVIFWHVLQTSSTIARMLVGSSCGFWLFTTIFRILRVLWSGYSGIIIQRSGDADVLQLIIRLTHPIKLPPGSYFYIFFPAIWLKYNSSNGDVTELIFILLRRGDHAKAISQLREGQAILLDGPYVVLAAKGMGIAAMLPLALGLAVRRHYDNTVRKKLEELSEKNRSILKEISSAIGKDLESFGQKEAELAKERDAVKKIDLFWSLETLQALDPHNELFVVWCGFLRHRTGHAPFKESMFWKCLNPNLSWSFDTIIVSKLKEERSRLPGSLAVIGL
ncbi:hypothetical protein V8C42DRAFT_352309 [Trichoderma barbatum]